MINFSLRPDIRTMHSSIISNGINYEYHAYFSKKQTEIIIRRVHEGIITVDVPIGMQKQEIENSIIRYLENIQNVQNGSARNEPEVDRGGTIHIRGFDIRYTVTINRRRKSPFICSCENGAFRIELPGPVSEDNIKRILESEKDWIYREYHRSRPESPPEVEHHTVRIEGTDVPYIIRRNSRLKRITLRIHGNGTIEIAAPFDAETERIKQFVQSRTSWIAPKISLNPQAHRESGCPHEAKPGFEAGSSPGTVEIQGHVIPYQIIRNKRARRVSIKIDQEKNGREVCPLHVRIPDIATFMNQKADWVYENTIGSSRPLPPRREYRDGEIWPFLGDTIITRISTGEKPSFHKKGKELYLTIPSDFTDYHKTEVIKEMMSAFYAESLHQFSLPLFQSYAQLLGIKVPLIKMRDQKTKWGACTAQSITLNLRLCMAPTGIIEYVIVHELSHRIHPNHSQYFWNTVEQIMPDYRDRKDALKKEGYSWVI